MKAYAVCEMEPCLEQALSEMKGIRVTIREVDDRRYTCHCGESAEWYISEIAEPQLPRVGAMINGYTITGAYRRENGVTTILARMGGKFVVATWLNPKEWHHGNYFDTDTDEGTAGERATRRFLLRSELSAP